MKRALIAGALLHSSLCSAECRPEGEYVSINDPKTTITVARKNDALEIQAYANGQTLPDGVSTFGAIRGRLEMAPGCVGAYIEDQSCGLFVIFRGTSASAYQFGDCAYGASAGSSGEYRSSARGR